MQAKPILWEDMIFEGPYFDMDAFDILLDSDGRKIVAAATVLTQFRSKADKVRLTSASRCV